MVFKINDTDMPLPSSMSVSESDLDSDYSGRTASGRMNRYTIRKKCYKARTEMDAYSRRIQRYMQYYRRQ